VGDSQSTDFGYFLRASEAVAPSLVIDIVPLGVENAADIERAIDSFGRVANGGLVVPPGSTTILHSPRSSLSVRKRRRPDDHAANPRGAPGFHR
jgi:hypothetical protein